MSCFNIQLKVIGSDLDPIPWKTFRIRQNDADPSESATLVKRKEVSELRLHM